MHLLSTIVEKGLYIILQLRAAHDRVVAEHHTLILQQGWVGNEFHLGHQRTTLLIARSERARPCRRILQHRSLIRHALTLGIA